MIYVQLSDPLSDQEDDRELTKVDDGKVLDLFGNSIEGLVHCHTVFVVVMAEADADYSIFFD